MPTVTSLKTSFQAQIAPGDATEFLRILTEADMRLLEYGRWRWTRGRDTLTPVSGYVTLPTTYASILGARVGKNAVEIRDEDYEFVPGGVGEVDLGTGHSRLIDQGLVEIADPTSFASVTINPAGADNSFTLTAVEAGPSDVTFELLADPDASGVAVSASGDAITASAEILGISISGALTDGADPLTIPDMTPGAAVNDHIFLSDGDFASVSYVLDVAGSGLGGYLIDYSPDGGSTFYGWYAVGDWSSPHLATGWVPISPATGTPVITPILPDVSVLLLAMTASTPASALVAASASGAVTGALGVVSATSLSGGENMQVRRYKVAGYLADDDVVTALMHYAPVTLYDPAIADSMTPDDATVNTRCPDATALKLMMLGIVCEEASDREGARSFIADALRSLDGKEQSQRGNATRTINSRPMGLNIRRIRGWR